MEQQFETLDTYILLAKKIISKFASSFYVSLRKELLSNDEAISEIAEALMIADWKWDANRKGHEGKSKTRYSYRNQCGIWAIKTYISNKYKKKNNHFSIDSIDNDADINLNHVQNIPEKTSSDPAIIAEANEQKRILSESIKDLFESDILSDKQKNQIYDYYFNDCTLLEIGKKYGVTREAIRQNIQKGLAKIKEYV